MPLAEVYSNNKKTIFTSFFLFIFMFFLFFYFMEPGFFQHDMVEYAMYAEYVVLDNYDALYHSYFANLDAGAFPWRTGTMYLTVAFFWLFHLFGIGSEFATFLVQFFFGSLSIVVLYLFLLELYQKQLPALLSALFFGLSAPLFNAVLSKEQGVEFFFAFAAMYLLLLGIKEKNTFFFILASTALGFLLWTRESSLFFPIIFYGFFLFHPKELLSLKTLLAIGIPYVILAAIACKMYVWLLLTTVLQTTDVPFFTYADEIVQSVWQWYPLLFFFFLFVALYFAAKKKSKEITFFLSIILLFFLAFTRNGSYDIRHLGIYVFFPASVIICYGLCCLENRKAQLAAYFLAGILCVQLFVPGIALFEQRKEHVYTEDFGLGIASVVPADGIVFVQKDFCLFVAYYAKRACQGMPTSMETFDDILASGKRMFVFYEAGFGFYDAATKAAIEERYVITAVYSGKFETFHHADLEPQTYDEMLIEVSRK